MAKRKPKKTQIKWRQIGGLIVVCGIALFGAYRVVSSGALTSVEQVHWGFRADVNGFVPEGQTIQAKSTMALGEYIYTEPQHAVLVVGYDTSRIELVSVTCKTSWGCYKSQIDVASTGYGHRPNFAVCVNIPSGSYSFSNDMDIYSAVFKTKTNLSGAANWWTSYVLVAPGTCESNPTAQGGVRTLASGGGVCGGPQWDACNIGPSPGEGDFVGFGPQGDGDGGSENKGPTGSGGGSKGSTAKKVANKPNTVPSAAPQGETAQPPKVEPSPFYDGKQYAPRSDSIGDDSIVSSTIRKTGQNWPYATITVVALAVAGYLFWHNFGRNIVLQFRRRHK